ncbi:preprotein translocase subunit SecG, partial [Alphaproteobacteria bacterium]|nr:preprotein translocase subunit SecG [Alphaproteobacteria bacterium]
MTTILLVIHLMVAIAMIVLVLLQRSEGGALGIGGGNDGMMSARGLGSALTR